MVVNLGQFQPSDSGASITVTVEGIEISARLTAPVTMSRPTLITPSGIRSLVNVETPFKAFEAISVTFFGILHVLASFRVGNFTNTVLSLL